MALEVVTPKKLELKIGAKKPVKRELTALTVEDALKEMGVKVEKRDIVKPGLGKELDDGDRVVFTDIRVVTKRVKARDRRLRHHRARGLLDVRGRDRRDPRRRRRARAT